MGFPGTWMTESESMVYRVVPKCACSTIGQIMYRSDHGRFFDGDIHDAQEGLHKWGLDHSRGPISDNVTAHKSLVFSCVRNPYERILSSFFDKICGIQRNGRRYRGNLVPKLMETYGVEVGDSDTGFEFDQIRSFRRFLLFVRDTIRFNRPMDPDIHWSAMSGHVSTLIKGGGRYDVILHVEDFEAGMAGVLARAPLRHPVDLGAMPRFNESEGHGPKRAHPVEAFFDDLSMHLVREVYGRDFELFGYDIDDPSRRAPRREIDLDAVHAKLGA
ncbi:MAG: sulfotransferase family protein [Limimaricola soesokkakensis]|uniref:sulfotransferase family protein n=1 Tax=Limimaricola soesokkakensis TaxID=1343159 RepID=UPI00405A2D8A